MLAGLFAAALLVGCMTIDSRNDPGYDGPRVYSGTRLALRHTGHSLYRFNLLMFYYLADLPFSFVADTLLLPVTISEDAARQPLPAAEPRFEREAPSVIAATEGASPLANAKRLFAACRERFERLDPTLTDCYAIDARIVLEDAHGAVEITGADYKGRIRAAIASLGKSYAFVSIQDPAYSQEGGRVRIEAQRLSSFGARRQRISLLVGPGPDGGWRIIEEVASGWP